MIDAKVVGAPHDDSWINTLILCLLPGLLLS